MTKYNVGDKFIIEIETVSNSNELRQSASPTYFIKNSNLALNEPLLDKLERKTEENPVAVTVENLPKNDVQRPSKEIFAKIINTLKREDEYLGNLSKLHVDVFKKLQSGGIAISLLQDIMGDKTELISWWIWDKNYGENDNINMYDENNEIIELKTAEQLYDYIVAENPIR